MSYKKYQKVIKKIPTSLPQKKLDDYKTKYQKTINAVLGKWYIDNMNTNMPPTKIKLLIKNNKPKKKFSWKLFIKPTTK